MLAAMNVQHTTRAAIQIQRIARGRAARRECFRKKLHTVTGATLLTMLEEVRLFHDHKERSDRIIKDLDNLPQLVPLLSNEHEMEKRTMAAKDISFVLCESQGEHAEKAFRLIQSTSVAHFVEKLAREQLETQNTAVLYPLLAIMSNLPALGAKQGEDLLKSSGCFELLIDCLYATDVGVQYYAVAAVSNMSHDLEAVQMVKSKKAQAQLEKLLDSDNRHIVNFAIKALENVTEVQGAFSFLFKQKKRELAERKEKMELARVKYRTLSDKDAKKKQAATQVQRWVKGHISRRGMVHQLEAKAEMVRAAIRIQAAARGKITRTKTSNARKRARALRLQASLTGVSRAKPRFKKRVKDNRSAALQMSGKQRIERARALAQRLSKHDAARPVHTAMLLDATRDELDELEASADAPTKACYAILDELRKEYGLACAGGGPSGIARLERAQPLVAKYDGLDGVGVHAAMLLFASRAELDLLQEEKDVHSPHVRAVLRTLAARHAHAQAAVDLSATAYERLQALLSALEQGGHSTVHSHMLILCVPSEVALLEAGPQQPQQPEPDAHAAEAADGEEAEPRGTQDARLLRDLRLRSELALASAASKRSALVSALRQRQGLNEQSAQHAGVLLMGTKGELRRVDEAWPEGASACAPGAEPLLAELAARYALALATFNAEVDAAASSQSEGRAAARVYRPLLCQSLQGRAEQVEKPALPAHPGSLALCTLAEMAQLEKAKDIASRECLTMLTDARVRLELALSAAGGSARLERVSGLLVKFERVPFVHSGLLAIGTKPELKRLHALDADSAEAAELLETLRLRHERAAAELIAAKRERQAKAAAEIERNAKLSSMAASVRPTIQKKVAKSTAVATHAQAVVRGNEGRKLAAAKRDRQNALSQAQKVYPVYSKAAKKIRDKALTRVEAATVIQKHWRGLLGRREASKRRANRKQLNSLTALAPVVYAAPGIFDAALKKRQAAAVLIQRHARARAARIYVKRKRALLAELGDIASHYPVLHQARSAVLWLSKKRHLAAIQIQRYWRGARRARRAAWRRRRSDAPACLRALTQPLPPALPASTSSRPRARLRRSQARTQAACQDGAALSRAARARVHLATGRTHVQAVPHAQAEVWHALPAARARRTGARPRGTVLPRASLTTTPCPRTHLAPPRPRRQGRPPRELAPMPLPAHLSPTHGGVRSSPSGFAKESYLGSAGAASRASQGTTRRGSGSRSPQRPFGLDSSRSPEAELAELRKMPRTVKSNISYYPGRAYLQAMHSLPSTPSRKYINTERGQTLLKPLPRLPNGLDTHLAATLKVPHFNDPPPAPREDMRQLAYGARKQSPKQQRAVSQKLAASYTAPAQQS